MSPWFQNAWRTSIANWWKSNKWDLICSSWLIPVCENPIQNKRWKFGIIYSVLWNWAAAGRQHIINLNIISSSEVFLSDPSLIIALSCHWFTALVETWLMWPWHVKLLGSHNLPLLMFNCSSQPSMINWLSSPISLSFLVRRLFVCPAIVTSFPSPPPPPSF